MVKSKGATPGAILSATPGATPRQRPVNGGATHTPYTPSVAPALGGWVHAPIVGRRVREVESAMSFVGGAWSITGDAAEVRRSDERGAILTVLTDATEPMTPRDIANDADMKRNNVDRLLGKMAKAGEILKVQRGRYIHPARTDLLTDENPPTPGKNGKKVRNENGEDPEAEGDR